MVKIIKNQGFSDDREKTIYKNYLFAINDYFEDKNGVVLVLDYGDTVFSAIDDIDKDIDIIGIVCKDLKDVINLHNVKFEIFPNLKICNIFGKSIGIDNNTFNNCSNIEILNLSTPIDYPFDKDNSSSLYTLTNLKRLDISGFGAPLVKEGLEIFIEECINKNKNFKYNFYV